MPKKTQLAACVPLLAEHLIALTITRKHCLPETVEDCKACK